MVTLNLMRSLHPARLVLFPILLAACAPRSASAPPRQAGIDLAPITLSEAEPAVRESCEASVHRALSHQGFLLDPGGPRVEVEASFWQDSQLGATPGTYDLDVDTLVQSGATASPGARRSSYTADLTATIHLGSRSLKVMTSGVVSSMVQGDSARPTGGPSRSLACDVAAERLAAAMVEVMNAP